MMHKRLVINRMGVKSSKEKTYAPRSQPRTHVAGNAIKNIWKANTK